MPKNDYAKKLRLREQMAVAVVQGWTAQLCMDCMVIVLNDPGVMGKDRFGKERLRHIGAAFNQVYREGKDAFSRKPNASHIRSQIDRELQKIAQEDFIPWGDRYDNWDDRGI